MKTTKDEIVDILTEIKPYFLSKGIEKIALFGSFSKNNENIYSDIDIAIKKRDDFLTHHSAYDYFEILNELRDMLRKRLHRNVDIFDLDSNSVFIEDIKKDMIYA
jgi:predicted nucleotidyltransferase